VWAGDGSLNTPRNYTGGGQGIQTDALCAGGNVTGGVVAKTEIYNGTSWTEQGDLSLARGQLGQSTGTSNSSTGWVAGGTAPAYTNTTEEFANPVLAIKTVTTS